MFFFDLIFSVTLDLLSAEILNQNYRLKINCLINLEILKVIIKFGGLMTAIYV